MGWVGLKKRHSSVSILLLYTRYTFLPNLGWYTANTPLSFLSEPHRLTVSPFHLYACSASSSSSSGNLATTAIAVHLRRHAGQFARARSQHENTALAVFKTRNTRNKTQSTPTTRDTKINKNTTWYWVQQYQVQKQTLHASSYQKKSSGRTFYPARC